MISFFTWCSISFSKMLRQVSLTVPLKTVLATIHFLSRRGTEKHNKSTVHKPSNSSTVNGTWLRILERLNENPVFNNFSKIICHWTQSLLLIESDYVDTFVNENQFTRFGRNSKCNASLYCLLPNKISTLFPSVVSVKYVLHVRQQEGFTIISKSKKLIWQLTDVLQFNRCQIQHHKCLNMHAVQHVIISMVVMLTVLNIDQTYLIQLKMSRLNIKSVEWLLTASDIRHCYSHQL